MDYQPTTLNEMLQQIQAMSTQRTNQQQSQFQYQPPQQQTLPYQMPQQQTLPYQMPKAMDIGGGVGMMPPGGWQQGGQMPTQPTQPTQPTTQGSSVVSQDPNIVDLLEKMKAAGMQNHPGYAQLASYAGQQAPTGNGVGLPPGYQIPKMDTQPVQAIAPQQGGQMAYIDPKIGQDIRQMPRTMDIGGGVGMMPPGGWQRGENTTQAQGLQPGYGQPSQAGAGNPFAPIPNYGTSYSPNTMTNRQNQGFNLTTN